MIHEIRLGNARVFEGDDWKFPLTDLTVLCGTNSAGKSTVLKSLLLLKQNITARAETSSKKMKLRFSGQQIDLGNFLSFISHRDVNRELKIGFSFSNVFISSSVSQISKVSGLLPGADGTFRGQRYVMHCDFTFAAARPGPQLKLDELEKPGGEGDVEAPSMHEAFLDKASFRVEDSTGKLLFDYFLNYGPNPSGLDSSYILDFPKPLLDIPEVENPSSEVGISERARYPTTLRGLVPDRISISTSGSGTDKGASRNWPLPSAVEETLSDLRRELALLVYIGPLRTPAERYYMGQPDYNLGSDSTGKSLPYLLRDRLETSVTFGVPGSFEPTKMALGSALDYWLYYLRTGNVPASTVRRKEINIDSPQDILVEINIRSQNGEEIHALADSGFGYSQLLPILVRGLLLSPGSPIVIEQPEVHLNPALQARLGEFLIGLAVGGKQVIIETHSEHIVNYLRARSAEMDSLDIDGGAMILYLETVGKLPKVHNLCIASDGTIPEWPPSFFGESLNITARILRAQRLAKSKEVRE